MKKLTKMCLGATLALTLGAPAFAQEDSATETPVLTPETVVAAVNGEKITVGHMVLALAALDDQYKNYPLDVLFEGLREQLIQQVLLEQSLTDVPAQLDLLIENERRRMIAREAANQIADAAVTEAAVEAAYDRDYVSAPPVKEYSAAHILVETEDEASAALVRAEAGEDFGDLARELSTGPSGPGGGDLGWFQPDNVVPPFAEAVMAMSVGDIGGPVQTQFGWHIIKLNEARDTPVPPLAQVRMEIEDKLRQDAASDAVQAMIADALIEKTENLDPAAVFDGSMFEGE